MDWKSLSINIKNRMYYGSLITRCYLCDAQSDTCLCHACQSGLQKNTSCCKRCRRPLNVNNIICGQCQTSPPSYHLCIAPYLFDGTIKSLIHNIKFNDKAYYVRPLMETLGLNLIEAYNPKEWPQQIVYVPSHPKRIKARGFCQTRIMTKLLLDYLKEIRHHTCPKLARINPIEKIQNSEAQHTLNRKDRLKGPKNNYKVKAPIAKHVALFDDIMTTGSTIEACVKALKAAGAERVDVWLIARTPDKLS